MGLKNIKFKTIILCQIVLMFFSSTSVYASYEIQKYRAIFETVRGSSDVYVTLDITYKINKEWTDWGCKLIGKYRVEEVIVKDQDNNILKDVVDYVKEPELADFEKREGGWLIRLIPGLNKATRISWSFPPIFEGEKRVLVSFTLKNALIGDFKQNKFVANWVGEFLDTRVNNAEYVFIFPHDFKPINTRVYPYNYEEIENKIIIAQEILINPNFNISFEPGFVTNHKYLLYSFNFFSPAFMWGFIVTILLIFGLFFMKNDDKD